MTTKTLIWDGDPCGCVMCADADATLCLNGEPWCHDCCQAANIAALRGLVEELLDSQNALIFESTIERSHPSFSFEDWRDRAKKAIGHD